MWLKKVTIDGFKSYGQEVEVGEFAPQFNAITGLNGSGKSNILDSICYVMALKSLQQMRVSKLDDLVYKSGQAGVRKARVTLTFDNSDKAGSPPLYRNFDQIIITRAIVVGGRDKYTINNKTARPSEVHGLFHSVGLNVNNPHFLIMQGRISKVINMRPSEILSLVEEAAGTKIYENKKRDSENRMLKKENELQEIEELIKAEIDPQMAKLTKDRECHTLWTRLGKEITEKQKLLTYMKYLELQKNLDKMENKKAAAVTSLETTKKRIDDERAGLVECQTDLAKATDESSSIDAKEKLKEMEVLHDKHNKQYLAAKVAFEGKKSEQDKIEKQISSSRTTIANLTKKKTNLENSNAGYLKELESDTQQLRNLTDQLEQKERELDNLRAGTLTELDTDGVAKNLLTLIAERKKEVSLLQKEVEDHKANISMYTEELSNKPTGDEQLEKLNELKSTVQNAEARLSAVKKKMETSGFDDGRHERAKAQLTKRQQDQKVEQSRLDSLIASIKNERARTMIQQAPEMKQIAKKQYPENPKVHEGVVGPVFTLFQVKETKQDYSTALEQIAGAKLNQCVVADDDIAEKMIKACKNIKRSVVTLPLNRLKAMTLDKALVNKAKKLSPDVYEPMELIDVKDNQFDVALRFVFSGYLICRDQETARRVNSLGLNCVTIDGDSYNHNGSISGGSTAGFHKLLSQYRPTIEKNDILARIDAEIQGLEDYLGSTEQEKMIHDRLRQELEKEYRYLNTSRKLLQAEQDTSSAGERESLIERLEAEKVLYGEKLKAEKNARDHLKSLETKQKQSKSEIDKNIKELERLIPKLRKSEKDKQQSLEKRKTENTDVLNEIGQLKETIEQKQQTVEDLTDQLESGTDVLQKEKLKMESIQQKVDDLASQVKNAKSIISDSNELCSKLKADITKIEKRIEKLCLEVSNQDRKFTELQSTCHDISNRLRHNLKEHPWMEEDPERHFENYDPNDCSTAKLERRLEEVREERARLEPRFNKKVLQKIDEAEKNYTAITDRRHNVLRDREAIIQFIKELDRKKEEEVETCQRLVNEYFNSIFSTLLPGTQAALDPVEDGKSNGLLMKVAFNGKWKSGLTELSGGQRSLLALSFILALLKYKPAPLYILDEVDAALDLSHTQNIGKLIHNHFKGSQFIIVSLKPNLFTNADVIFKTKLHQGMSQVKRLVGSEAMLELVKEKHKEKEQKQKAKA